MSNAIFGFDNWGRTGAISASASAAGLGPEQMQNPHGATSSSWQTPSGTTTAHVVVDAATAVDWGAFGLFNNNLTPSATVRWRVGSDATFATSSYDSGTLSGTVAAGYRQSLHIPTTQQTARYMRVDISDAGNPEGRLRVAQLFAGRVVRPVRNIGFESAFAREAEAPAVVTRGGQQFPTFRYARRSWRVALSSLDASDVWTLTQALQIAGQDGSNVLFVPFPAGANVAREAVFGIVSGASGVGWPSKSPALRAWAATITERL
jgi:hypothetical protein